MMFHVKQLQGIEWQERLISDAARLSCPLTAEQSAQVIGHAQMMIERNQSLNLTAITDPEQAYLLHILDSLAAAHAVITAPCGDMADIGSGGGYPGIPLAIATHRHAVMLESVGKKAGFLADVIACLGLEAESRAERSEDYAKRFRESFSVVTARAVAELSVLVELASPLLTLGGRFIALKGVPSEEELQRGSAAAEVVGMGFHQVINLTIPGSDVVRALVVYEKRCPCPSMFPRRPGMAQKRPLA